jgi:hypothetical protein
MKKGRHFSHIRLCAQRSIAGAALSLVALGAQASDLEKKLATPAPAPAAPAAPPAPPPGPIGVFGVDMPAAGKLVVSITPTIGNLSGIKMGTRTVSNEYIVSTVPFFLNPTQTVRIVPQNIAFRTQILGLSYGVTRDFNVVLNAGMVEKSLDTIVFKGASGVLPLARNYPTTASLSDFALSGVYRVYQDDINRVQISLGFSFPTGSNTATFNDFILPNRTVQNIRGFYGMQLGTGTFDIMPGVVYAGYLGPWSWGASYRGRFPLGPNPQGYLWGDLHELSGWGGYTWIPGLTTTLRASASLQGPIRGWDPEIRGAAVPSNPLFYGGQRVELFGGATVSGRFVGYENWSLGVEAGLPVYQNLNGPQIMKNWQASMQLKVKI